MMTPRKNERKRWFQLPGSFGGPVKPKKYTQPASESFDERIARTTFTTELECDMCGKPFKSLVSPETLRESVLAEINIPAILDFECRRRAQIYPEVRDGLREILKKKGRA